mmetsp:Transcript_25929/g.66017  ORF Transcript_25929/g.66017 Transcript_25929/m.66017 type:complete len:168 (-) Transcript_25929:395-898(-)
MPSVPVINRASPAAAQSSQGGDGNQKDWETKDYAVAGMGGAAVCVVTGIASVATLGLVGIGAGVGYAAGQWIADKMDEKDQQKAAKTNPINKLHPQAQASLEQWRLFLAARGAGRQLTPVMVGQIFAEFEQHEPGHAQNVRSVASPDVMQAVQDASGVFIVNQAAEV